MHKRKLPIANPCHENWDAMHAEGGGARFCDQCSKSVHNLSDMTESDAQELLAAPRGKDGLCIRYTAEPSGKVRFRTPSTQAPSPTAFLGWRNAAAAEGLMSHFQGSGFDCSLDARKGGAEQKNGSMRMRH